MKFRWSIPVHTVAIAWVAVLVTSVAGFLVQRSVIREQGVGLVHNAMRGIVLSAESTRAAVAKMNASSDFDRKSLVAELQKSSDFRSTRIYDTIPVVAAWKSIQQVATSEGYEFRTPSSDPRNPKNAPDAEEQAILAALEQATADRIVFYKFDEADAPEVLISISEQCQRVGIV